MACYAFSGKTFQRVQVVTNMVYLPWLVHVVSMNVVSSIFLDLDIQGFSDQNMKQPFWLTNICRDALQ